VITDLIVHAFLAGVGTLLGFLPDAGTGRIDQQASSSAAAWGTTANGFFPVTVTVFVLLALLVLETALLLWDLVVWIYHQFWGSE
jgi:hypothetical protein